MAKYTVTATQTKTFEIEINATDPQNAIDQLDEWISDDFENFETATSWKMEAK